MCSQSTADLQIVAPEIARGVRLVHVPLEVLILEESEAALTSRSA